MILALGIIATTLGLCAMLLWNIQKQLEHQSYLLTALVCKAEAPDRASMEQAVRNYQNEERGINDEE